MTAVDGRVLLAAPDQELAAPITRTLTSAGLDVIKAPDGIAIHRPPKREQAALAIVACEHSDDRDQLLSAIHRARPQLPIIILAAQPTTSDSIRCLNQGAIDYLPTSISPDELSARVRAHLRIRLDSTPADPARLRVGDVELDRVSRRVARGTSQIILTPRESDILAYLMQHAGLVITRSRLHHAIWGFDYDPRTNIVEVYIGYLRRKLGSPEAIKTVRGLGYRLTG